MKRTPIKVTLDQVRAWQRRPRKPLPRTGRKYRREQEARDIFAETLRNRHDSQCEVSTRITWRTVDHREIPPSMQAILVCGTTHTHGGVDPHHLWPEDRDAGIHDPTRGLWVCREAHRWIHDHPQAAHDYGLLRPEQ